MFDVHEKFGPNNDDTNSQQIVLTTTLYVRSNRWSNVVTMTMATAPHKVIADKATFIAENKC